MLSLHSSACLRPATQETHTPTSSFLRSSSGQRCQPVRLQRSLQRQRRGCPLCAEKDGKGSTDLQDEPVWARRERLQESQGLPFGLYLIGSFLVATAAIGSIFEWSNKNPVFGVLPPTSPFYTPILGFFAITGLPSAGLLFLKAIKAANEASERQDKADGF
ncbi:hypothetical protein WJX84_001615 [Apatococcus fuscideae]|uniref:Uncharacterized protein n=1 Tax=Apatococcus fuscideae TaxID=2026836 RepID=A0AAW1ST97_9CHLO